MITKNRIPVLFLLMEFPPVNTTGNYRSLKFIKNLPSHGIEPIVVTFIESEGAKIFNAKIDVSLLSNIPEECTIYRIKCNEEKKSIFPEKLKEFLRIYFSIKDTLAERWKPNLLKEIEKIISKHKPNIIYTSLPPFSSGLLAYEISKKYDIPYILDMRDLWSHFGNGPLGSKIHYLLTLREERKIFSNAIKVIGVTPQMITTMQSVNHMIDPQRFTYISNGFDINLKELQSFSSGPFYKKIIIGYVGSFYYDPISRNNSILPWYKKRIGYKMLQYSPSKQDWLYRSPFYFFKVISKIIKEHPEVGNLIYIEFIGKRHLWLDEMIKEFNLSDRVTSHGFVTQNESFQLQNRWDVLLATSEKIIGEEHYCLPSKIFNYINLNKPILGFVTPGIQKEFIEKSGLGLVCDPDDVQTSTNIILGLLKNRQKFYPNINYLKDFHVELLTKKLSDIFRSNVQSGN